jgi:hypothetical protein
MADDITLPIFGPPDPDALIPLTAATAPQGTQPPNVKAGQLDNPPRVRANAARVPVQLPNANSTFAGLAFIDMLNLRMALVNHQKSLLVNPESNAPHLEATKRVLSMVSDRLAPRLPQEGLVKIAATTLPDPALTSQPAAEGVKPLPLYVPTAPNKT